MLRFPRLVWLALIFFIAAAPAQAEDFAAIVAGLAGDSFAVKEKGVTALGKSGEVRAASILQALGSDRLRKTTDGRVVIVDGVGVGAKVSDAATEQPITDIAPDSLDRIIVNNRLRGAIEAALGALTLFSPDRGARFAAAQDALHHPSAQTALLLEKALTAEQDPEIRATMQRSFAASQLFAGSKEERLAALRARGISLGSVLLLAAIGLAITFGVMGVINMAHGEMIMTGAYVAFVIQQLFRAFLPPGLLDAYLLVAVPMAFLFAGSLGVLLERCLIRFLYGRPLETLLATWGVSLILQQAVRSIFGSPNKEVANPSWMTGSFDVVGGFTMTWNRLYIIIFCFVVLGALALILNRTRFGLHMRAVTQNRDMAAAMGIPTARIDALTFGLGSGIAGMAGVALSQIGNVSPNLGTIYIVDSFMVVVFGGVGNLMGTLVGALSLGIVNKLLEPYAGAILGKIAVLVAIILFIQRRPRGLFALKGRAADAEA